jgi:alpha-tubulin suppressor-like RCC1 family protein
MTRGIRKATEARGPAITLWLASVVLTGTSCRDNNITEPADPGDAGSSPALATAMTALSFYQLSGGQDHYTCGITLDYRAYCWGRGYRGQLGDGTTSTAQLTPVAVATTLRFRQVSAGWGHTCGLTPDYRVYCWGDNGIGQLGDGTTNNHYKPVAVAGQRKFRQVDAGIDFTCGVGYPDNRAYCWGNNWAGQLGDGTMATRLRPTAVVGGLYFKQVRTGGFHACGITTTNRVYCWGYNANGELGDSTRVTRLRPTRVASGRQFRQVDAGGNHTCAVTTTYRAFCWGYGRNGAIGNGKAYVSLWPRAVAGGLLFERVTTGNGHTCGETTGNQAYCWGDNGSGQVGDGTTTYNHLEPVPVAGRLAFAQVTAGGQHSCGKTPTGVAYCWGNNGLGALGDGTWQNTRTTPVPVAGPM